MKEVTDATFESEVLRSPLPTLVDFWAEWCTPCQMMAPVVEEIERDFAGRVQVVKMNVDANPQTPARLGIMGIPTLILFKDGREVDRVVGYRPRRALEEFLQAYLEPFVP
ncbi:MAG: thioredoxin [Anaerolineae bacterium]|nr:thioredoxin [Anaerolineae bacterium]MDW8067422.1 thioredoxin [Anaerolineae bacterium]